MSLSFDLEKTPFSRAGSYFSLSVIRGSWTLLGSGLYLHTHHNGSVQLSKLVPVKGQRRLKYTLETSAAKLILRCKGGGTISICIADAGTVRIQGRGVGLRMETPPQRWCYTYPLPDNVWAMSINQAKWCFALECLQGTMTMDAPWVKRKSFCKESERIVATIKPDADGCFEMAMDEFSSSWNRPRRPEFDRCVGRVEAEYRAWKMNLPCAPQSMIKTRDLAAYTNWAAVVGPCGYLKRPTMLMSKMGMCHVFGWDHVFNAMAHVTHQPDLAWNQLMVMSDQQDEHGKCADNMNDQNIAFTFGKPPVQGWALRYMMRHNPRMFTPRRLNQAYRFLSRLTDWFLAQRRWEGKGLPYYTHGFDSGWDNSTIFDVGVPLVSPDLAAYLALQMDVLADLATKINRPREGEKWRKMSRAMIADLVATLWRGDHFVGQVKPADTDVDCKSAITCMPIILGRLLPREIRQHLAKNIRTFLTPWGIATEQPTSREYKANGYWRGPIWAPSTLMVISGLMDIGEHTLARDIGRHFCRLCKKSGFAENFNALTGEGNFDPAYTWTSSVFMILAGRYC